MPSFVDSMRLKADQAALEADKLIRIRREQGAIDQLRRDIKTQLDALGQAALTAYRAGEIAHPQLVSICQQIDVLDEQIGQREARIEQIRAEKLAPTVAPPTAAGAGMPCPSCKQFIPEDAAFCPACGYKIPKPQPAEIICSACGASIPAAAQFCPNCGARKSQAPQTIRCASCDAELPATAVFCPDCGARVVAAAPAIVAPVVAEELTASEEAEEASEPEEAPRSDELAEASTASAAAGLPAAEPVEDVVPAMPEVEPELLTKPCPSCRTELPLEAIFCPECGARQQASQ